MSRFVAREATFMTLGQEHFYTAAAILEGFMLERVKWRVSFACDELAGADARNWVAARVGWGLWFGPSTAAQLTWSSDRQDQSYVAWQAFPWVPDMEWSRNESTGVATTFGSFRAGVPGAMVETPVYRFAAGQEFQVRTVDVDSELTAFPGYTMAVELELFLWSP